jgi:hypothetical protein
MKRRIKNLGAELVVMGANPAELVLMGANSPAAAPDSGAMAGSARKGLKGATEMCEDFKGSPCNTIEHHQEPSPRPMTLAQLGVLVELQVKRPVGWKWGTFDFTGRGVKLAANPTGTQLYLIGGNQKISRGELTQLGLDNSKEMIDLGEAMTIAYRANKAHVNGIASDYEHHFGDKTGVRPRLTYDRRGPEPRIHFQGGEYVARVEGIDN